MKQKKEYDPATMGKAMSGMALRVIVSAYLVYLAWKILSETLNGGSPIPAWGAWLIFLLFVGAAAYFCVYAWKRYKKELKSADISADSQTESYESDFLPEEQKKNDSDSSEDL